MLLGGLRAHHQFETMALTIPAQWERFRAMGAIPGRVGGIRYGAICGTDVAKQRLEYMCAVEVESFAALPETIDRMRVPDAHYAVFTHDRPAGKLGETWTAIWEQWVPTAGYQPAPTPDFERYGEGFDVTTMSGDTEIWLPIVRKDVT